MAFLGRADGFNAVSLFLSFLSIVGYRMMLEPVSHVNALAGRRILIVGDLVADQFLNGTISRVSREAPVFILRHEETETRAGGAANAAVNVSTLGGTPLVVGCIGKDEPGRLLLDVFRNYGIATGGVVAISDTGTTTKVRVLAGHHYASRQQVIRIDHEMKTPLAASVAAELNDRFDTAVKTAEAIVVSDYGYGVVTSDLFERAKEASKERSIPLVIDSRFRLSDFCGATSATPNQEEAEQLAGSVLDEENCEKLRRKLDVKALLITQGNKGMSLIEESGKTSEFEAVGSKEPLDVTGAGDTVIAAYALGLAAGLDFAQAANLANHAGGIVVMKRGTAAAGTEELELSLSGQASLAAETASLGTK